MSPWLLLTPLVAGINLTAFVLVRGRWGRITWLLGLAALLGTAAGDRVGAATNLELVRIGDFNLVAASVGAQLAMLATLLLVALIPTAEERPTT
jgi:hypothetical protein